MANEGGGARLDVEGLAEFRAQLQALDGNWGRELSKVHRKVAKSAAEGARGIAIGMGGVRAKAASKITGSGDAKGVKVGTSLGIGGAAFWGTLRHTGWYAKPQYRGGPPQHPRWVGNDWQTGAPKGGPYAINRAIFLDLPHILTEYDAGIKELTKRAFPD